nr:odorant receptor 25 [Diaphania glauculalis]
MVYRQIDCFNIIMKYWKILGLHPEKDIWPYYNYYSFFVTFTFIILYDSLLSLNFFYLPRELDKIMEDMVFYFMVLSVVSKAFTLLFQKEKIMSILNTLESDVFQPDTEEGQNIIKEAKIFNLRYLKIEAAISATSHITHITTPLIVHFFFNQKLELPVCTYSFLSNDTIDEFVYPLYFYQILGMHFQVLYNVNIDSFFVGVMVYVTAQLDILNNKYRHLTDNLPKGSDSDRSLNLKLNEAVNHYREIAKFCDLIQNVFSKTLFVQFGVASLVICICLFRFTLPATADYYVFLSTYLFIMVIQIMIPCWLGTRIIYKSCLLASAIYSSDWTPRSRRYTGSIRILVERLNKPLSIIAGKMFPVSLNTFTGVRDFSNNTYEDYKDNHVYKCIANTRWRTLFSHY